MRARGTSGDPPPELPDPDVWRRSQQIEALADEAERLLELAAFADNRLDDDDAARVAALLARDPNAADDVAAARTLNAATAADPGMIARAIALVDDQEAEAEVIAFPVRQTAPRRWYSAATWSGLAAAMLLAGWLGFNLGSGLSGVATGSRADEAAASSELIDFNPPLLLRDFNESAQI